MIPPTEFHRLEPRRPYSLARTAARLAAFPEVVDRFDGDTYRRLLFLGGRALLMELRQEGPPSRAELLLTLKGAPAARPEALALARLTIERVLGAGQDVRPFYRKFRNDPLLGDWIRQYRGLRVVGRLTIWESLLQMVLSQQINLTLAHRIMTELATALGRRARFDGDHYYNYPTPERLSRLSETELREFKLSAAKAGTLLRLARAFGTGELSEAPLRELSDEEFIARLTAIKGVGPWTAEFTLLRGLSRLDVFPASDLGVIKYLAQELLGREAPAREEEMRAFSERWRPYRGLALIYAYAELVRRTAESRRRRTRRK